MKKLLDNQTRILSLILILSVIIFILSSEPFLRLVYDPWFHLSFIRRIFEEGGRIDYVMWPGDVIPYQSNWHVLWASVFKVLSIDNTFVWASIIHKVQSLFLFFSLTVFSYKALRLLLGRDFWFTLLLSVLATILWMAGMGTASISYQQSWLNWYSLTAQGMSMSFFWLGATFVLDLFWSGLRNKKRIIVGILAIVFFSVLILLIHELEFIYLVIFFGWALVLNFKKIYKKLGIYSLGIPILVIPLLFMLWRGLFQRYGTVNVSRIIGDIEESFSAGQLFVDHRSESVLSELVLVGLLLMSVLFLAVIINYFRKKAEISIAVSPTIFYTLVTLTFLFIPITPYLSVALGEVSSIEVIWRFRFAMLWFLFIPVVGMIAFRSISKEFNIEGIKSFTVVVIVVSIIVIWSGLTSGVVSKNIDSLEAMFNNELGVQYTEQELAVIQERLSSDDVIYIVRGDIGYLAVALYGRNVLQTRFNTYGVDHRKVESYINQNGGLTINGIDYEILEVNFEDVVPLDEELEVFRPNIYRP